MFARLRDRWFLNGQFIHTLALADVLTVLGGVGFVVSWFADLGLISMTTATGVALGIGKVTEWLRKAGVPSKPTDPIANMLDWAQTNRAPEVQAAIEAYMVRTAAAPEAPKE